MKIHGFQKMTLLDFPGRVACTVFTAGCNLRCPFCHNAGLVTAIDEEEAFDPEEILAYIRKRQGVLDGVAVTGGEPLLYSDTLDFLRRLKELGMAVKLDTNGTFPARLKQAVAEGLVDYVAMDIKNAPDLYAATTGMPSIDLRPIRESVAFLLGEPVDYEFRTTIVAEFHSVEAMERIGHWIAGAKRYFLQNFVDSGHLISDDCHGVDRASMELLQKTAQQYVVDTRIRGL